MSDVNAPDFWESFYRRGVTRWDLGGPTPPLRRLLEQGHLTPGRMIVLGAGRGYDARLYARAGFDVTAVDFAAEAVAAMRALAEPDAPVEILHGDLFELPAALDGTFDYVLEYTCYCAIDPARRADYAGVVSRLLRPGGRLIALLFPLEFPRGGPPFVVDPDALIADLVPHRLHLTHREIPPDTVPPRRGQEELLLFRKAA